MSPISRELIEHMNAEILKIAQWSDQHPDWTSEKVVSKAKGRMPASIVDTWRSLKLEEFPDQPMNTHDGIIRWCYEVTRLCGRWTVNYTSFALPNRKRYMIDFGINKDAESNIVDIVVLAPLISVEDAAEIGRRRAVEVWTPDDFIREVCPTALPDSPYGIFLSAAG